jgi:hypothetical protein
MRGKRHLWLIGACLIFGCGGEEWVRTDYPGYYAQSRTTGAGLRSELHTTTDARLVATMDVAGNTGSWRDSTGTVRRLVVTSSSAVPATWGRPDEMLIMHLPTDERTANETLYLMQTLTPWGRSRQSDAVVPSCQANDSCAWCCDSVICCWDCDDGRHGCCSNV